jgi:hypothetical protein
MNVIHNNGLILLSTLFITLIICGAVSAATEMPISQKIGKESEPAIQGTKVVWRD